jgi:apolipoprotein N-acyltransferase
MSRKKKSNYGGAAEVSKASVPPPPACPWRLRSLTFALLGAILFSPLGWIATIPFLILVRQHRLLGKRPYRAIWFASSLAWLLLLEGIRRPYWALYFGWFALSIYAAAYIPLFVGAARILVHRWRWPLAVAAPVVWIGLELLRGYVFSGFSVGLLAHTQFQNPLVIQIADLFGHCGVSFLLVAPAAAFVSLLPRSWIEGEVAHHEGTKPQREEPIAPRIICAVASALLVAAALAYGSHRLRESDKIANGAETLQVALIQGNVDVVFGGNTTEYLDNQWTQCRKLTREAAASFPDTDLVVWPESCFLRGGFDLQITSPLKTPSGFEGTTQDFEKWLLEQNTELLITNCQMLADRFNRLRDDGSQGHAKFLVGSGSVKVGPGDEEVQFNSALLIDDQGKIESRYYKMHRVMFGEYIPIVDLFPNLYRFTPLPAGIRAGDKPTALHIKKWVLCPSICFESTVPHLLRNQSHNLAAEMAPCDAFVNLTNDGWFWGSGVQDLHLHCAIFRAVENRRPVIVAANSGFSVHCDAAGRIKALGKRRKAEVLSVTLSKDNRTTPYHQWGDWPVFLCLLVILATFVFEFLKRRGFLAKPMKD